MILVAFKMLFFDKKIEKKTAENNTTFIAKLKNNNSKTG
jgi:hypothetical protein